MSSPDPAPDPYHIVYIDEAGDPGLTKVRPKDPDGASEWLVLGAVVIKASAEPKVVSWVREIREDIRDTQGSDLHFRTLSDHRRVRVADMVAQRALRGFALVSHKPNMKAHKNDAAEAVNVSGSRGWFYNWCIRLLLERVTQSCALASERECGRPQPVKLVFSQRGGVKYNWLRAYIEVLMRQSRDGTSILTKRLVRHEVLDPRLIQVLASRNSAGCQLADVIASAFYSAADAFGPRWNTNAAERLRPCMTHDAGFHEDCGVSLQPTPARRAAQV